MTSDRVSKYDHRQTVARLDNIDFYYHNAYEVMGVSIIVLHAKHSYDETTCSLAKNYRAENFLRIYDVKSDTLGRMQGLLPTDDFIFVRCLILEHGYWFLTMLKRYRTAESRFCSNISRF